MATVTTLANPLSPTPGAVVRHMDNSNWTYVEWREIDFAAAAAAKGSALAAGDVIESVRVAPGTLILGAWASKTVALTGTVSVATLDLGTAVDPDQYVDGWDLFAAAVGEYGTPLGVQLGQIIQAAGGDTVDITLATQTGTITGGKVKVGVLCLDLNTRARGVIAQPKS